MAGLPEITLDSPMPVSIAEVREQLELDLTDGDRRLLGYFFLENDCRNLVRLLKNPAAQTEFDGNYTTEQYWDLISTAWEDDYTTDRRYPAFMSDFARNYPANKVRQGWFAEDAMLLAFYQYAQQCSNKMIRSWYRLNLDITNILTAMIARQNGWNVGQYIQGDNEVTETIRSSQSRDFSLTATVDYMKELMQIVDEQDPVLKEKRLDAFRWLWLDDQTFMDAFSVEAVFAYLCKLRMLSRWQQLDPETGRQTFSQIIEDLRSEARVPDEFKVNSVYNKNTGNYAK
jgi:hypothetical protein